MKLSTIFKKIKAITKEAFGIDKISVCADPTDTKVNVGPKTKPTENIAIIIKQNKGNVLIKCWNDGKETWVKKGSNCHTTGLCNACIMEIGMLESYNA